MRSCAYIAVLCAAVLLYVPWRIGHAQTSAWLVTAVAAFALQGMHWFMLLLGNATRPVDHVAWIAAYQIVATWDSACWSPSATASGWAGIPSSPASCSVSR